MDQEKVLEWLQPGPDEVIVDLASGNGYIAQAVAPVCRRVYLADPSTAQLASVARGASGGKLVPLAMDQVRIPLGDSSVDAVYSFGGFHHMRDHYGMLRECRRVLKTGGRLLVCDVLEGSALARHFDDRVARYCVTGHHRSWLNPLYLESLLATTGFKPARAGVVSLEWVFDREEEVGVFLKGLHGMACSPEEVLEGVKAHLGILRKGGKRHVPWHMHFALARKTV
jgi:SAM-dependent methyltransferase